MKLLSEKNTARAPLLLLLCITGGFHFSYFCSDTTTNIQRLLSKTKHFTLILVEFLCVCSFTLLPAIRMLSSSSTNHEEQHVKICTPDKNENTRLRKPMILYFYTMCVCVCV